MKNGRYEKNGDVYWYKDDLFHREDGPAIEWEGGTKEWYANGKLHRLDDPAIEWSFGGKEWIVNGKRHRLHGPAIERADGTKVWYVDGQEVDIIAVFGYLPSVPLTEDEQLILRLSV